MEIKVNNKPYQVAEGVTLAELSLTLALPSIGVAIAVDNALVPRVQWQDMQLSEGCEVLIIKAACGG